VKLKFEKKPRQILPRVERGADWGAALWLILDAGSKGRVFWWPGSMGWSGRGQQSYRAGSLQAQRASGDTLGTTIMACGKDIPKGCRLTAARLNAPSVRTAIAKALNLPVDEIPPLDPKVSWVLVK